jgi:hypothetical protein
MKMWIRVEEVFTPDFDRQAKNEKETTILSVSLWHKKSTDRFLNDPWT